jgi:hypothetical protein
MMKSEQLARCLLHCSLSRSYNAWLMKAHYLAAAAAAATAAAAGSVQAAALSDE